MTEFSFTEKLILNSIKIDVVNMKSILFTVVGMWLMSNVERETLNNVYPMPLVSLCLLDHLFL